MTTLKDLFTKAFSSFLLLLLLLLLLLSFVVLDTTSVSPNSEEFFFKGKGAWGKLGTFWSGGRPRLEHTLGNFYEKKPHPSDALGGRYRFGLICFLSLQHFLFVL